MSARYGDRVSILARRRRFLSITAVAVGAATLLTACGSADSELPLTGLVLSSDSLPAGYSVVPADVEDLVAGNRRTLEQAASVAFTPEGCTPTADAAFTPELDADNTVLLVAQSDTGTLSELVTTVRRNLDADRRATTGVCAVVTAVPSQGTLAGSRIVTTSTELPAPSGAAVEQALVLRSDSVTALTGGRVLVRSTLLSNVLVRRPSGEVVTVQVNVGSPDSGVLPVAPEQITPPLPQEEYLALVQAAVDRAAR